ncbi:glycosyltransferase family 2 protein [Heliomicrobium modesticaldum]|uniref:glycosyltransferase family 2 protein n=1 Tax=Heliomicrobium modesticaldum TaxID=35701 RepID=UPI0002D282D8|nr:glycosyltransferase family 2 protein [Heliomicrobium modesticaldum]
MKDALPGKYLVIIPAYNEAENIGGVLDELNRVLPQVDVVVIDDGSRDRTAEIAMERGATVLRHPFNLRYGAALQTGFKYAVRYGYDYVIQFDGDGQHDPANIIDMARAMKETGADIVIGSRFVDKKKHTNWMRGLGIAGFSFLIKLLTGQNVADPTSGLQLLNRRVFYFYSRPNQFPVDFPDANVLVLMILAGFRVTERPASIRERLHGESMHRGFKVVKYLATMIYSIFIAIMKGRAYRKVLALAPEGSRSR